MNEEWRKVRETAMQICVPDGLQRKESAERKGEGQGLAKKSWRGSGWGKVNKGGEKS